MGKHRHTGDRMFLSSSEWKNSYGGKRAPVNNTRTIKPLSFDQCALSLTPYETPCCTPEGVLFDFVNLVNYVKEHKTNPVSGEPMTTKDIIRLDMSKNPEGEWQCPVSCKSFNDNSHVVAIRTTGQVYMYETVNDLNIKAKNWSDLMTGEKFTRSDIITLQNPQDEAFSALRDSNNFVHLQQMRAEAQMNKAIQGSVRHTTQTSQVMKAYDERTAGAQSLIHKHDIALQNNSAFMQAKAGKDSCSVFASMGDYIDDVTDILSLNPLVHDVTPGNIQTTQKSSSSFTSSYQEIHTKSEARIASPEEIRLLKYKKLRELKKKAYVQLQTTAGNINIEVHCDIVPRTAFNFIRLCETGYYDNSKFHRLIPGFMVQGGDPTGTGTGGQSIFGAPFQDEFDSRLAHSKRGVVSMANSGSNANKSQFFITFQPTEHLNMVHAVFGQVVGGLPTLKTIEEVGTTHYPNPLSATGSVSNLQQQQQISANIKGSKDAPLHDVIILSALVFNSPWEEAGALAKAEVEANMAARILKEEQLSHIGGSHHAVGSSSSGNSSSSSSSAAANTTICDFPTAGEDGAEGVPAEKRRRVDSISQAELQHRFLQTEGARTQQDLLISARANATAAASASNNSGGRVRAGAFGGNVLSTKPPAAVSGSAFKQSNNSSSSSSYGNFSGF